MSMVRAKKKKKDKNAKGQPNFMLSKDNSWWENKEEVWKTISWEIDAYGWIWLTEYEYNGY